MGEDKFAPRIDNVKQEKIGKRPSEYSEWHRTLGREYLTADIDFVEYRIGRGIVALIDVTGEMEDEGHLLNSKRFIWERTKMQREILSTMSKALGVPAFFVLHTKGMTLFHVYDLSDTTEKPLRMTNAEYTNFIKKL
jgi:hypothetical protein